MATAGSRLTGPFASCLQIEMLSPYEAVAERFKEQYKTFAMALDTTRHKLPVRSVHLDGDEQQFLGRKRHLLGKEQEEPPVGLALPACWHLYPFLSSSQTCSEWWRMQGAGKTAVCPGWCPK